MRKGLKWLGGGTQQSGESLGQTPKDWTAAAWGLLATGSPYLWLADAGSSFLERSKQAGSKWLKLSAYLACCIRNK